LSQPHQTLLPENWPRPKGYSNGMVARGRQVFIAGQVGWNSECRFTATTLAGQLKQALQNIVAVLAEAKGRPEHIVRLTWYLTSREEYLAQLKEIGAAYREVMGNHYPTMTAVQVVSLIEAEAKVEIEATAVVPDVASA
jgi:enamine deaminase RidA (YjgF/YER057c/UK114 family)